MKLDRERIVDAAMQTCADVGLDGLSMRRVADRLDVHAGSLYYHVPNKEALLRLMADRVARHAYDAAGVAIAALPASAGWVEQVVAQAVALRGSVTRHPGGAVLLAGSPTRLSAGALSLMERLLETLRDAGLDGSDRAIAADTVLSHVTGFALQEQSVAPVPAVTVEEVTELRRRFPLTMTGPSPQDVDEQFVRSVRLICAGIAALRTSPQPGSR